MFDRKGSYICDRSKSRVNTRYNKDVRLFYLNCLLNQYFTGIKSKQQTAMDCITTGASEDEQQENKQTVSLQDIFSYFFGETSMIDTPVSVSPSRRVCTIGEGPRHLGSKEGWIFIAPLKELNIIYTLM